MKRRRGLLLLKIAVSAALLAWVIHAAVSRDGVGALHGRLRSLDLWWLTVAVALQLVAVAAGVVRWRALLRAQRLPLPGWWLARVFLIGRFVGSFTPSTTGLDLYRTIEVARRTGHRGRAASVTVVEKLIGLLGLAFVTATLLPLGGSDMFGPGGWMMTVGVALGCGLGLVALRSPTRLHPIVRRLPPWLGSRARRLLDAIAAPELSAAVISRCVGLSVLSHLAVAAVFVATSLSLGLEIDPLMVLLVGAAIVIATLLPVSIGGVGVRESVAVVMLASVGVGAADATLVALLGYLTGQVPALAGGLLALWPTASRLGDETAPSGA